MAGHLGRRTFGTDARVLQGAMNVFGVFCPGFRMFVLLVRIIVFIGLWLLMRDAALR
jgi:hypothetical protein